MSNHANKKAKKEYFVEKFESFQLRKLKHLLPANCFSYFLFAQIRTLMHDGRNKREKNVCNYVSKKEEEIYFLEKFYFFQPRTH